MEGCRVMESKKKPLWLTMKDANGGEDLVLMLKVGDDLRQDALIMQLLRVMSELWRKEGLGILINKFIFIFIIIKLLLEMQMMLYDCISTGDERGLLQVVLNADTLGTILLKSSDKNQGGKSGSLSRKISTALKALSDFSVLREWIIDQVDKEITAGGNESLNNNRQLEIDTYGYFQLNHYTSYIIYS